MTERAKELLIELTGLYIDSGEPVSSSALSKVLESKGRYIPPSTIRMELGKLEQQGFLVKPHPSGGRIPTTSAYRVYINSFEPIQTDVEANRELMEACRALSGELGRLLDYTGEILATESGYLGFVTSPSLTDAKIGKIMMNLIEEDILLLRLELSDGRIYHHLAKLPIFARNLKLDMLWEFISERLSGRKLDEVSEAEIEALMKRAAERVRGYEYFIIPFNDLINDARLGESPRTILHGAAGLLKAGGEDPVVVARAVEFLDDRARIEQTLNRISEPDKTQVIIGGEFPEENYSVPEGLSLIITSYRVHARARGQMGILGPLRMQYKRNIQLVRSMADLVSKVLISREISSRLT